MLPPVVTKSIEHLTSTVFTFAITMIVGAFVAMILAKSLGGSRATFSMVMLVTVCAATYLALAKLRGS